MRHALLLPFLLFPVLGSGSAPSPAMDQAYVVPLPVAKAAVALLRQYDGAWRLCEPCGESEAQWDDHADVGTELWEDGDGGWWVVTLDGTGVDLAYVYVPIGTSGQAANLALLTGMTQVSGVSAVIRTAE